MTTIITGSVHSTSSKTCFQSYLQLQVKIYSKTLSSKKQLQDVAINEEGAFTTEIKYDQKPKYSLYFKKLLNHILVRNTTRTRMNK